MRKAIVYPIVIVVVMILIGYFCWFGPTTTLFLVRHAEKALVPGSDPPLSAEGLMRAQALAHVLKNAGIDAIFATEYQRTQQTVGPTADAYGLTPVDHPSSDTEGLIDQIFNDHKGEEVLVSGHSNTLPEMLQELGIQPAPGIPDEVYDNLFIVRVRHGLFQQTRLIHLKFGNPTD